MHTKLAKKMRFATYKNKTPTNVLEIPEIRVYNRNAGVINFQVFKNFEAALDYIKTAEHADKYPVIAYKDVEINIFVKEIKLKK